MTCQVLQTRRFSRAYKKLHDDVAKDVNDAVVKISNQPIIGEKKKGDLSRLFVYKFRSQNQQCLLGYTINDIIELVTLEAIGSYKKFTEI